MSARTEIGRLRQPAFAQSYAESRDYVEASGTEDGAQAPVHRTYGPVREKGSEVRGQRTADKPSTLNPQPLPPRIALLTGGGDKPYALGMAAALTSVGILLDFIGSDDLDVPELLTNPRVNFLNLRGDQHPEASPVAKGLRVLKYYVRLIGYSATAKPKVFHLLWNNKFELFDRTLLMLYYRMLGKKITLTVHNVNAGKRDLNDSFLNRLSLRIQYNLCDHIFVHAERMKSELVSDFRIPKSKVSVIPFGINNTVPNTKLSCAGAKQQLNVSSSDKTLLFFGNIAPYKGLEYLISAFAELLTRDRSYRLIIVGKPKGSEDYWAQIQQAIARSGIRHRVIERIEYVPDEETELFFKAADVLVLPYTYVFQSGVLFLGYSFGLPAIAADVGSLKEEIIEGKTGFAFESRDASDLASKIDQYFKSELFRNLESRRAQIKEYANERYSWRTVAALTTAVYSDLLISDL
jgi:glycosyltransferase involved in cell wall biosynthesis